MARANGIPANDVFKSMPRKQTTRMSANVSGFASTMRITLNDNLLRRGSPEEIQAVMGHEMGHYVLNHIYKGMMFAVIVVVIGFASCAGRSMGVRNAGARAGRFAASAIPPCCRLFYCCLSIFGFVLTPISNTYTRTQEHEADMFGLNASRQPDGFAQAAIHLGEYRKMSPGPAGRMDLLRSSQRPQPYPRRHAVESGESATVYGATGGARGLLRRNSREQEMSAAIE